MTAILVLGSGGIVGRLICEIGLCAASPTHQLGFVLTSDYRATAACAVAMAGALLNPTSTRKQAEVPASSSAVYFPFEVFTLEDLAPELADVVVQEQHFAL